MKITYFAETDTLLLDFGDRRIVETRDVSEDVLVELDENGRLVTMTIEHAKSQTDVREFAYQFAAA